VSLRYTLTGNKKFTHLRSCPLPKGHVTYQSLKTHDSEVGLKIQAHIYTAAYTVGGYKNMPHKHYLMVT